MPLNPIQAAVSALVADLGAAAVSFGVLNNATASAIVTAATAAVSVAFVVANELRHRTLNGR